MDGVPLRSTPSIPHCLQEPPEKGTGVREADGGVMSIITDAHDPSGPSGHLPIADSAMGREV